MGLGFFSELICVKLAAGLAVALGLLSGVVT